MSRELRLALEEVASRSRRARAWAWLALGWSVWAVVGLALLGLGVRPSPTALAALAAGAIVTGLGCWVRSRRSERDLLRVARRVEAHHPELNAGLLAAVAELSTATSARSGFLRAAVIQGAVDHSRAHEWRRAVPGWKVNGAMLAHAVALAILVAVGATLAREAGPGRGSSADRSAESGPMEVRVEPGDAAVERGNAMLVVARFPGAVPADANLVVPGAAGPARSRPMTRSLDDPAFAARIEAVEADLTYRVDFDGRQGATYHLTVFEYPALVRADAELTYPGYTGLEPKTSEDIRHVSAVEGTALTLLCRLNKDVASAKLLDGRGGEIALNPPTDGSRIYRAMFTLVESRRYKLQLIDNEGRQSKPGAEISVNVTRNNPPTIAMARPGRDVRVSPVEELRLGAEMADDFGVIRHGVQFERPGGEPVEVVLGGPATPAPKKVQAAHLIDFEALKAEPDQLVSFHAWAEDFGPDGKTRRTDGDMFFAEVRAFEEIFRQGEPPPGGAQPGPPGGNARQAEQLAELQKQVINATWKVARRETNPAPTPTFAADAKVLQDSQQTAIEQAAALAEKLRDPASKANLAKAVRSMEEAASRLGRAAGQPATAEVRPALNAEQAAYQALLKLRAREFEVVRNNSRSQQGGESGGSPSQQQLDQLELSNDENRYEQQSKAREEQLSKSEQEQRETRQVVNRLRELARRQADLNERLKETQAALQAAPDEPAKQELERQLKRLRDQQQQILRDTDELQERMESEPNRDRMAEARQQVEQGREHVRQASEALDQGQVSKAITEGTRAGRQLDEVREDLRKEASNRFGEDLNAMRDQARKLDEDQTKLTEQLEPKGKPTRQGLRDTDDHRQVKESLDRQRKGVDELVDRMRKTVGEAEESEPLLAKKLFDAARKADEQAIGESLREAEKLAEAGIADEAAKASGRAGRAIGEVRQGVERAAGSILGDETAALKRARDEVEDLTKQVDRELAQAGPDGKQPASGDNKGNQAAEKGQPGPGGSPGANPGSGENPQPGQAGGVRPGRAPASLRGGGTPGEGGSQAGEPRSGPESGGPGGGPSREEGPITGEGFRRWSDRMREVEEILDNPELRAEAARIRDRVRGAREEFKRHARPPSRAEIEGMVAEPIRTLRDRIAEEVRRRESPDALVPIDRDPVPPRFAEGVRRYYERLGSGR